LLQDGVMDMSESVDGMYEEGQYGDGEDDDEEEHL
jgi:hypothetical protein